MSWESGPCQADGLLVILKPDGTATPVNLDALHALHALLVLQAQLDRAHRPIVDEQPQPKR
jgi:hypothetical protein